MKKKLQIICLGLLTLNLQLITKSSLCQNVGINTDGSTPESNTMLDIKSFGIGTTDYGLKVKNASGTNRFVVRNDGNIGIGTTTPNAMLEMVKDVGIAIIRPTNGTSQASIGAGMNDWNTSFRYSLITQYSASASGTTAGISNARLGHLRFNNVSAGLISAYGNVPLIFANGTDAVLTEKMRISGQTGNVGIGVSAPETTLDIKGPTPSDIIQLSSGNSTQWHMGVGNSTGSYFSIYEENAASTPQIALRKISGNVGIGTTSPQNKLDIEGAVAIGAGYSASNTAPTNGLLVQGNTGIGTPNPVTRLHIFGGSDASMSSDGYLVLGGTNSNNIVIDNNEIISRFNGGETDLHLQTEGGRLVVHNGQGGTTRVTIEDNGDVGIGTSAAPKAKLEVNQGDAYMSTIGNGVILRSPDGSCYRVTVANGGALTTTSITCP